MAVCGFLRSLVRAAFLFMVVGLLVGHHSAHARVLSDLSVIAQVFGAGSDLGDFEVISDGVMLPLLSDEQQIRASGLAFPETLDRMTFSYSSAIGEQEGLSFDIDFESFNPEILQFVGVFPSQGPLAADARKFDLVFVCTGVRGTAFAKFNITFSDPIYDNLVGFLPKECPASLVGTAEGSRLAEREALRDFYFTMGGLGWSLSQQQQWANMSLDVCPKRCNRTSHGCPSLWAGSIQCDNVTIHSDNGTFTDVRVVELKLRRTACGNFPPSNFFARLPFLTRLDLRNSKMTINITDDLLHHKALRILKASQQNTPTELRDRNCGLVAQPPLPENIGQLTELLEFELTDLQIPGTIPQSLSKLTRLSVLALINNTLSGPFPELNTSASYKFNVFHISNNELTRIPSSISAASGILSVKANNNFISDFPSSLGDLNSVGLFDISNQQNASTTIHPNLFRVGRRTLSLFAADNAGLEGELPPDLFVNHSVIDKLFLRDNRLSGFVPPSAWSHPTLTELRLDGNQLSGQLPTVRDSNSVVVEETTLGSNLRVVHISRNSLDGQSVLACARVCSLAELVLDFNAIQLLRVRRVESLVVFSVAHNQLHTLEFFGDSKLPNPAAVNLPKLVSFDISFNRLQVLPILDRARSTLLSIVANDNLFRANGRAWEAYGALDVNLTWPNFIAMNPSVEETNTSLNVICPLLEINAGQGFLPSAVVKFSSAFNDYRFCSCAPQHFGINGVCRQCPLRAVCPGGRAVHTLNGFYPSWTIDQHNNIHVVFQRCPSARDGNPCSPGVFSLSQSPSASQVSQEKVAVGQSMDLYFRCGGNFDDRLCSRCARGYFLIGGACERCQPYSVPLLLGVPLFVGVLLVAFIVVRLYHPHSHARAFSAVKLAVGHLQLLGITARSGFLWPFFFPTFFAMFSVLLVDVVGAECVSYDHAFHVRFYAVMCLPVCCIIVPVISHLVSVVGSRWIASFRQHPVAKQKLLSAGVFIAQLSYIPVARKCAAVFFCALEDGVSQARYLVSEPYFQCVDEHGKPVRSWVLMVATACFVWVTFVMGVPLSIYWLLRRAYPYRYMQQTQRALGALYFAYMDGPVAYHWSLVELSVNLIIAVVAGLSPDHQLLTPLLIFTTLIAYGTTYVVFQPFKKMRNNLLRLLSIMAIAATFFAGSITLQSKVIRGTGQSSRPPDSTESLNHLEHLSSVEEGFRDVLLVSFVLFLHALFFCFLALNRYQFWREGISAAFGSWSHKFVRTRTHHVLSSQDNIELSASLTFFDNLKHNANAWADTPRNAAGKVHASRSSGSMNELVDHSGPLAPSSSTPFGRQRARILVSRTVSSPAMVQSTSLVELQQR